MILYKDSKMSLLKNKFVFFFLLLTLLIPNRVSIFKVDGMMCLSGCVVKVNSVTNSINGVKGASVDFKRGILTVEYDSTKVNEGLIISELSEKTTYSIKKAESFLFNWLKIF